MGNFMKKFFVFTILLFCTCSYAEDAVKPAVEQPAVVPQNVMFENCSKIFKIENKKLFYLTLASISANKFTVDEIQTTNGYIMFTANRQKYLATVAKIDDKDSILKITPCNNIYKFPPAILSNVFKYIDLNLSDEIKS